MTEDLTTDLLCSVADSIKTGREMMGSRWNNCEAEVIACQTLTACAMNYREHGDAFSWQGTSTTRITNPGGGGNNPDGMRRLIDDGCIKIEPYTGDLQPPKNTVHQEGIPMVIRVTERLLHYAAGTI